jgi:hypothetical protein
MNETVVNVVVFIGTVFENNGPIPVVENKDGHIDQQNLVLLRGPGVLGCLAQHVFPGFLKTSVLPCCQRNHQGDKDMM